MGYKVLLTEDEILEKVRCTAKSIATYLKDNDVEELILMPIMNGSIFYTVDLMRALTKQLTNIGCPCKLQIESIRIKSYENNSNAGTELTCKDIDLIDVRGKIILIVDDVYDTGNTFKWLVKELKSRGVKTILSTVFVDKTCNHDSQYTPNFIAHVLTENKFLVGYGMDDCGYYREWTHLGYVENP